MRRFVIHIEPLIQVVIRIARLNSKEHYLHFNNVIELFILLELLRKFLEAHVPHGCECVDLSGGVANMAPCRFAQSENDNMGNVCFQTTLSK